MALNPKPFLGLLHGDTWGFFGFEVRGFLMVFDRDS